MYGKIHQRKLNQQDYLLSCEVVREELNRYIDDEARRVNIDSAKKRAVVQRMDYQGFRQMVLGANLFSLKTNQLLKFSQGHNQSRIEPILNPVGFSFNKNASESEQILQRNQIVLQELMKQRMTKETVCNNFAEFKKNFNKHYSKELTQENVQNLYALLKDQNRDRILKIFTSEFDSTYFCKICEVFDFVISQYIKPQRNLAELFYIVRFLETICELKNVKQYIFMLLTKKQKQKIVNLLRLLTQTFQDLKSSSEDLTLNIENLTKALNALCQ